MSTGSTVAYTLTLAFYTLTLAFYGLLLCTTPLLFLSACFGHLNPMEFYGANMGVLALVIVGDVSFIIFTIILLLMSYDKLIQFFTRNNVARFKVFFMICVDFVLSIFFGGKDYVFDPTKMAVIAIALYALCSVKLICGSVDGTRISHFLFEGFLFITIEHLINQNLIGFVSCGTVVLTAGMVEVTPSLDLWNAAVTPEMARAYVVSYAQMRRAIPL